MFKLTANNVRQLFTTDDFSRRLFSDLFFLGALRVKYACVRIFVQNLPFPFFHFLEKHFRGVYSVLDLNAI